MSCLIDVQGKTVTHQDSHPKGLFQKSKNGLLFQYRRTNKASSLYPGASTATGLNGAYTFDGGKAAGQYVSETCTRSPDMPQMLWINVVLSMVLLSDLK